MFKNQPHRPCPDLRRIPLFVGSDGLAVIFVNENTVFYQTLEELLSGVAAAQMAAATDEAFNDQLAELRHYARSS